MSRITNWKKIRENEYETYFVNSLTHDAVKIHHWKVAGTKSDDVWRTVVGKDIDGVFHHFGIVHHSASRKIETDYAKRHEMKE